MKKILIGLLFLTSISLHAESGLKLNNLRDKQFELNSFSFDSGSFKGNCNREAIQDNTFANSSRELRSEGGLLTGARGYFFDDLERCSQLNFSIMIIKSVDFFKNELKISFYKADWSKGFGFKPIQINGLYDQADFKAKCSISEVGLIFKDIHLNCILKDRQDNDLGTIRFVEN
ncbi:MAG: hypothetical protein COW00_15305 [Bdellovibrio sp. CG12_big_fil_rev_8_21_14_0_65_39_13]|nr:MAG: hypothetical protein COW78_05775 [Bdellovibrio sp. CG22_combo_CG10-13_8_21_14_all_39_27]PIQ58486.1 MAG: hypothetical protein COW00_15305 [Bdellovibrio sp. CG12_big_fil_rev_8_21_14_0_65_39_13]PIR35437.1 MAG: hypothetical protein COV37_08125 [Bdellovibrio sp. CG11_big_fil_rev_8_21_14_0_20_39_38]